MQQRMGAGKVLLHESIGSNCNRLMILTLALFILVSLHNLINLSSSLRSPRSLIVSRMAPKIARSQNTCLTKTQEIHFIHAHTLDLRPLYVALASICSLIAATSVDILVKACSTRRRHLPLL